MKTVRIHYDIRDGEQEYAQETVFQARSVLSAERQWAKDMKLKWWPLLRCYEALSTTGDHRLYRVWKVEEIVPCPHCNGTGTVVPRLLPLKGGSGA